MNFLFFFFFKDSAIEAQLLGNSQEASRDSYLEAMEKLEAFFHELNDTYGTENSAAPEAELCAPLTAHEEDSQKESMQNQVKNLLTHNDDLYMS